MDVRKWGRVLTVAGVLALALMAAPGYAQEGDGGDMGPGAENGAGGDAGKKKERPAKKEKKEGGEAKKKDGGAPAMEEFTLTGKLAKVPSEKEAGGDKKAGGDKFMLTLEDNSKVMLPAPRAAHAKGKKEGDAPPAVDLAAFDGKNVTVVAMGTKAVQKKGDKEVTRYMVRNVKSVVEAAGQ